MKEAISIRLSEEEREILDKKTKLSNMRKSDYIRQQIFGEEKIEIVNKDKEIYSALLKVNEAIEIVETEKRVDLSSVRREVWNTCRILSL